MLDGLCLWVQGSGFGMWVVGFRILASTRSTAAAARPLLAFFAAKLHHQEDSLPDLRHCASKSRIEGVGRLTAGLTSEYEVTPALRWS